MKNTYTTWKFALSLTLFGALGVTAHAGQEPTEASAAAEMKETPEEIFAKGNQHLAAGEFAEAKAQFENYLSMKPEDGAAWKAMGKACFGLRWFEDATESFAQADKFAPEDGETLFYRGVLILEETTRRDKDARTFFDRSASIESPRQALANLMKYSMMKYINIKGRSVSKEFDAWRKALPQDSWEAQLANYLRRPVSNEKLAEQCATHAETRDAIDLELQRRLFIGLRNEATLYGLAADNLKKALKLNKPGSVEWELARIWYWRFGHNYNWVTHLSYQYGPNERGELEVVIKDRESFAMARGLKNGDEIVTFNSQPVDLNLLDASFNEMEVGEAYELVIRRDGQEQTLLLVMDTPDFRMRAAKPR